MLKERRGTGRAPVSLVSRAGPLLPRPHSSLPPPSLKVGPESAGPPPHSAPYLHPSSLFSNSLLTCFPDVSHRTPSSTVSLLLCTPPPPWTAHLTSLIPSSSPEEDVHVPGFPVLPHKVSPEELRSGQCRPSQRPSLLPI